MYKLMVKTHCLTGLKYLCKTIREDHNSYKGSGVYWNSHLSKHGYDIQTEVIYESEDIEEFKAKCLFYSNLYDVVNSEEWANLIPETGEGGVPPSRFGVKASGNALLKGNNRTVKQKLGSLSRIEKIKGRPAHNRIQVEIFGNKYNSKAEACKANNISYRELQAILNGS